MTRLNGPTPGLRTRKIQRTRAALIDAAVKLCLDRGYENTTVEQIATAAGVSPRTFSRYFKNKDAVFLSLMDDLADAVTHELHSLAAELGPLESMRTALRVVLDGAYTARFHSGSADRITRLIRVVTASDTLRQAAIDYRSPRVLEAMARRMNVTLEDRQLLLAMAIISVTVVQAWTELAAANSVLQPLVIANQIDQSFADLGTYAADLDPPKT